MDVDRFIATGKKRWERLDGLVGRSALRDGLDADEWSELASSWRSLCADLARSRQADLPPEVAAWLDQLAARAHTALYGAAPPRRFHPLRWLVHDVPRQVRVDGGWFLLATALFWVPFVTGGVLAWQDPMFAAEMVDPEALKGMEASYSDAVERSSSQDAAMAGFYVWNNAGIGLRTFATGALLGLGPIYFLVSNGTMLGAVFGHLFRTGHGENLLAFTSGHSAWELTAIVLSGAAGLKLGGAMVATGGRTRRASLADQGGAVLTLALGSAFMFGVAAMIEGFWSSQPFPLVVKHTFALVQVGLVAGWLLLGGRGR